MRKAKYVVLFFTLNSICLQGFTQQDPAFDPIHNSNQKNLRIAQSLIEKNEEDSAIIYLNIILSKTNNHEEALLQRVKIYSNQGKYNKALVDCNALVELYPENKEIRYARGIVKQRLEQFEPAINDFQTSLILPNGDTQTAYFKMEPRDNMTSGISTMSSMESEIWNNIGLCYHKMGNYDEAILAYDSGIYLDETYIDIYINRAISYEERGDIRLATLDYEYVLSKMPNHPIASFNLIYLQKGQNQDENIKDKLTAFILDNPLIADGFASRGLYYYEMQQFDLAQLDFLEATRLDPSNINYQFNLGLALEKTNNAIEAEQILINITEREPEHSGAYFNLGNIKHKSSQFQEAIAYYTLAHHYNRKNIFILHNRALSYLENDQKEKACEDMAKVLQVDKALAANFISTYCSDNQ